MVEYLVKEFKVDEEENYTVEIAILNDKAAGPQSVWDLIQAAKENDRKIVVYRLGECLIDFS